MKKLSESIWSDMEDRGTGDIIKKEDDLERLDVNDFCDYLNAKYKKQPKTISGSNTIEYDTETNQIGIPLFIWGSSDVFYVALIVDRYAKYIYLSTNFASTNIPIMDLLRKNYDITVAKNPFNDAIKYVEVKPKNKEKVTNSFFVDLIDFILDNANDWTYVHIYERV